MASSIFFEKCRFSDTNSIKYYIQDDDYKKFFLDDNQATVDIPYRGGTGEFDYEETVFKFPYNAETGYYDITLDDLGDGKWYVSILKTVPQIEAIPDQEYTGSEITPEPRVCAGSLSLTKGRDYYYEYKNNTDCGTATVTVTFIRDYASLDNVQQTFKIVPKETKSGALTITEDQNGRTAILDGEYTGAESIIITENTDVKQVVLKRNFTTDMPSTIILPFDCDASKLPGTLHTITDVTYNTQNQQWEAHTSDEISEMEANKPYIFKPTSSTTTDNPIVINAEDGKSITLIANNSDKPYTNVGKKEGTDENSDWQLVGVYAKKTWAERSTTDYGFAAKPVTYTDQVTGKEVNITTGEFVRAGKNASIKPLRCYLTYTGNDEVLKTSKSAAALPDRIVVIFPDETATVIDTNIDDPDNGDPDGDISTPASEISAPTANAKVWSYDHTIHIQSRPGTAYRIIDAAGRLLKDGVTATDRDEIRLGNHGGIAIVIINGKSFKTQY